MNGEEQQIHSTEGAERLTTGEENQPLQVNENQLKGLVKDHVREEIQKEIKFDKASLFTVFGIFASIVTFVSVEIQILRSICGFWNVVGFSIIMLASLLTFILILDYIGRGWRNDLKLELRQFPWILVFLITMLFIVGFWSASKSEKESVCREEAIYRKFDSDIITKQIEFEKIYDQKVTGILKDIEMLKKQIIIKGQK